MAQRCSFGNSAGSTTVIVQGVIYEKTLQAISNTSDFYKGFFLQNTASTADGDPNTSDGLFVFMNTDATLATPHGPYTPQVGDEVIVEGRISEFFNMTELNSASLVKLVRSGVDVDSEVAPVVVNPPVSLADANRYWERLQGMRLQVPVDSIVLGGRNVFNPADAEIWLARPDSTIAQRLIEAEQQLLREVEAKIPEAAVIATVQPWRALEGWQPNLKQPRRALSLHFPAPIGRTALVVARDAKGKWDGPGFYAMATASVGFQAGISVSENVTLVMTDKGMNSLLSPSFKIGGDASTLNIGQLFEDLNRS